jgi:hypothetical protein
MYSDPLNVPGYDPDQPTPEEVDAWAAREHKRREAWAAGPTQGEQEDWARQYRWRATVGLSESRLGPSPDEITDWAERERRRRHAWLAGPTDDEKREWLRRRERRRPDNFAAGAPMSADDEVEAWAERERQRRQAWLGGPTEDEKLRWARRETINWGPTVSTLEGNVREVTDRWLRDADLASKGTLRALSRLPFTLWSYLVESGRAFEEDFYEPPPRRRVRF